MLGHAADGADFAAVDHRQRPHRPGAPQVDQGQQPKLHSKLRGHCRAARFDRPGSREISGDQDRPDGPADPGARRDAKQRVVDQRGDGALVPGGVSGARRRLRRHPPFADGDGLAVDRPDLRAGLYDARDRPSQYSQQRIRRDFDRFGHQLRHLFRRPLFASAGNRPNARPSAFEYGRERGAGHHGERVVHRHRFFGGRTDRIHRRRRTGKNRRRRHHFVLYGGDVHPAGDHQAGRRLADRLAHPGAVGFSPLAGADRGPAAADADRGGDPDRRARPGARPVEIRLQSAAFAAGGIGERRTRAEAARRDEGERLFRVIDGENARRRRRAEGAIPQVAHRGTRG